MGVLGGIFGFDERGGEGNCCTNLSNDPITIIEIKSSIEMCIVLCTTFYKVKFFYASSGWH